MFGSVSADLREQLQASLGTAYTLERELGLWESAAELYDATANTWTTLAPMPSPRHGMGAAVVGGRMYIPGGANMEGFGAVATHDILTP